MPLTLLLPLLAQIGPGGALPQAPLPERRARPIATAPAVMPRAVQNAALQDCLKLAMAEPADAIDQAEAWSANARTASERAGAEQCKGLALSRQESWRDAAVSFGAARDDTPASEPAERARLGELAGNALLALGDNPAALAALDRAHGDSHTAGDHPLNGVIQIDRARALVALGRTAEAGAALEEARAEVPDNSQGWLLSATLSRREGKLAAAQQQIERAAALLPVDPEIGLEAGVIAVLSGRDEAARKSWQSVIAAAPGSGFAKTAQGYLDQLGPPRASPAQ